MYLRKIDPIPVTAKDAVTITTGIDAGKTVVTASPGEKRYYTCFKTKRETNFSTLYIKLPKSNGIMY